MPNPVPAPTPVNWGYVDAGHEGDGSYRWDYRVWVYWSNKEVTSKIVNIPRPASGPDDEKLKPKLWDTIDSLIREGTTFRHPDAELPTDPKLPGRSDPLSDGPPEPPPPDPDDPVGSEDPGRSDGDTTTWFPP